MIMVELMEERSMHIEDRVSIAVTLLVCSNCKSI